jgi:hypothetical protein
MLSAATPAARMIRPVAMRALGVKAARTFASSAAAQAKVSSSAPYRASSYALLCSEALANIS